MTIVRVFLGADSFLNSTKLHKGIVSLHVNANEFTVGFKEHLEIFALGGLFVEVDHKQSLGGLYVPAAVVFLALDAAITTCKFGSEGNRNTVYFPVGGKRERESRREKM